MKKQLLVAATAAGLLFTSFNGTASAHENTYRVQSGDTLWKIASANGITVTDLKSWNQLSSDMIYINQSLTLLAPHTHTTTTNYVVKSGDTLWLISKNAGMTVDALKTLNGLTSDMIYVGQVLKIESTSTNTTATTASVSKVDALVTEAKKYIGTPYVWGGSTPSGFDCSGYLNYVYTKVGVSIPRTVATIWNATTPVSSPKIGDIVFFDTTGGPSHAGIYLGDNKFIHASTSQGVTISDLNNTYWKPRYLGAKTPF
ncbi:NlpC/P60 family protein [Neobacillus sp. D3-1R]|uniref:C40 family peptidase n=1 Tax=Neobacillus sp. D3-1R TaxID=3445778 RepID=UPI003FA0ED04